MVRPEEGTVCDNPVFEMRLGGNVSNTIMNVLLDRVPQ
mgnify:CR=1 FL=1